MAGNGNSTSMGFPKPGQGGGVHLWGIYIYIYMNGWDMARVQYVRGNVILSWTPYHQLWAGEVKIICMGTFLKWPVFCITNHESLCYDFDYHVWFIGNFPFFQIKWCWKMAKKRISVWSDWYIIWFVQIIEEFQKCHIDHPIGKFFGECTNLKIKLDRCFREEVSFLWISVSLWFRSLFCKSFVLRSFKILTESYKAESKLWTE